jgi:tRNA A37 threonylcarbamoyladenosine dehydratase
MSEIFNRTELLFGKDAMDKLAKARVIVFGVGGVGGHCIEALVRSGIGHIAIVDHDVVEESNINRQLVATHSTLGKSKVEVMKERLLDINTNIEVEAIEKFYLPENESEFALERYDYIIDAVDTMSAKISLVLRANSIKKPIISAMGAGNKIDPTKLEVSDIYKTSVDPLAKILRHELKKYNIKHLKVVYSKEEPIKVNLKDEKRRAIPGSTSFVPSTMGLILASEVIKDLINQLEP